jgi:hypothetical protein
VVTVSRQTAPAPFSDRSPRCRTPGHPAARALILTWALVGLTIVIAFAVVSSLIVPK